MSVHQTGSRRVVGVEEHFLPELLGRISPTAAKARKLVLSLDSPGADLLPEREGVAWALEANDALAGLIAALPDRFAGLAHLPLTDPDAAA